MPPLSYGFPGHVRVYMYNVRVIVRRSPSQDEGGLEMKRKGEEGERKDEEGGR